MIFAQVPTAPPGSIESWLLAFAAICVIANQAVGLFKNFKNSPQFMQMAEQFTTRSSFHKHAELNRAEHLRIESRVAALERKLENDKDEIIAAGEARAERINTRLDAMGDKFATGLGEVKGALSRIQ